MKTELQKIGDAQAVFIPNDFLVDCGITKTLNLRLENHRIIIESVKTPRSGWFDNYPANQDTDVWQNFPADSDCEDWEW